MRTVNTIAVLICYCLVFNIYIFMLSSGFNFGVCALTYHYNTWGMVCFYLIDRHYISSEPFHRQFNKICIFSVLLNGLFIILTHHTILKTPIEMFITFNGLIIVLTAIILDRGSKYEIFD